MTERFWKATREDGRDFYTGEVNYAGALADSTTLPELPGAGAFPGSGWYHLATVPTECVGMTWPCRLFRVEPVGRIYRDDRHPHKIGSTSVRVIEERPAHEVFGPQGVHVVALIERASRITADEVQRLDAAWDAAQNAAWTAA